MKCTTILAVLVMGGLFLSPVAQAATSGTADVTLQASANAMVQILDPTVALAPTATDYDNDYVEAAGASGLRVRVKTNSTTGMALMVRCDDVSPQIALADLMFKTATAPGGAGSSIASYTAMTATDQTMWTSTVKEAAWVTVTTDVRVQNLFNYGDAIGGGTTDYTNTLTYTVIAQ
jgi:hypothetical protein